MCFPFLGHLGMMALPMFKGLGPVAPAAAVLVLPFAVRRASPGGVWPQTFFPHRLFLRPASGLLHPPQLDSAPRSLWLFGLSGKAVGDDGLAHVYLQDSLTLRLTLARVDSIKI